MTRPLHAHDDVPLDPTAGLESVEEYYARIAASVGSDGRLPTFSDDAMSGWEIFPYELEHLQVRRLEPLTQTEPPRRGEDPSTCWCATGEPGEHVWANERWLLKAGASALPFQGVLVPRQHYDLTTLPAEMAAELGQLMVVIGAGVESLPSIGRVHVSKWGDGGAHLHLFFLGRPARMSQLRGSCLPQWEEHLPVVPEAVAMANIRAVVAHLETHLPQR